MIPPATVDRGLSSQQVIQLNGIRLSPIDRAGSWNYHSRTIYLSKQIYEYTSRNLKYKSDALNAFRGILVRSERYSSCGHPLYIRQGEKVDRLQRGMFDFLRGLAWCHAPKVDVDRAKDVALRERQAYMSMWSWAPCRTHDPQWSDSMESSVTVDLARYVASVRVQSNPGLAELNSAMLSSPFHIMPEILPQLLFKDALLIRQIEIRKDLPKKGTNTCRATGYTISTFVGSMSILPQETKPITFWPEEVSAYFDVDMQFELAGIELGVSELIAVLITIASPWLAHQVGGSITYSPERHYDILDHYFLVACQSNAQMPAKRVGIKRAKLPATRTPVNPKVYTQRIMASV